MPDWIRRYEIPAMNYEGWAIIHVDSKGFFATVSDYGNYAFQWVSFGEDFVAFLDRIDSHYLCLKLSSEKGKEYDADATLKSVKGSLLRDRREGLISRELAREEWDLVKEDFSDLESQRDFENWVERGTTLSDAWEFFCSKPNEMCMRFCKEVYPKSLDLLHKDFPT